MIYNKSTHPIEVKKISLRFWSLRDEIEAAIERRMKECEAAGIPLYIDDIKKYYNLNMDSSLQDQSNVLQMPVKQDNVTSLMAEIAADNIDAPPMDEDEAAMLAAMNEASAPAAEPAADPAIDPMAALDADPTAALDAATPASQEGVAATPADVPADKESKTFEAADKTIAEQQSQGLDTTKPNAILLRPYKPQAPDLAKISYGFSFLSDVNMETLLSFTKSKYLQGQSVVVEFLIPQSFIMSCKVLYCHHYARTSRVISSTKPDYRVQCLFTFERQGERDSLRKFLTSVQPTIPEPKKKVKKEGDEDSLGF